MKSEKVYIFIGEGAGIPGLPHQVTKKEAKIRKVGELLEVAIKKGVYVEKKEEKTKGLAQVKPADNQEKE